MFRIVFVIGLGFVLGASPVASGAGSQVAQRKVEAKRLALHHHLRRETLSDRPNVLQAVCRFESMLPSQGFDVAKTAALRQVAGDPVAESRVIEILKGALPNVEELEREISRFQEGYRKQLAKQQQAAARAYQQRLKKQQKAMRSGGSSRRSGGGSGFSSKNSPLQQMQRSQKQFQQYLKRNAQGYQRLLRGHR